MDEVLAKIRDLEKEVVSMAKRQDARKVSAEEGFSSFAQWIKDLRNKAGEWNVAPLVVLSLFDGIGGVWNALSLLGIPFVGYSCEVNDSAIQVVKARYPRVHHVGDVTALQRTSVPEKVDLVIGGFPCQDLSSMGHRKGLHGERSGLFFEMLRVIKIFKPTWFLAENVASMNWQDRDEISKHLKTVPIEIDSQEITPSRRRRVYWTNIPFPSRLPQLRNHHSTSLQSVLKNATALDSKIGCILSQNTARSGRAALDLVMDNSKCELRYINVTEVEKAMGFPGGYTNIHFCSIDRKAGFTEREDAKSPPQIVRIAGDRILRNRTFAKTETQTQLEIARPLPDGVNKNLRWALLGNTFSVNVIAYLLAPLLESEIRADLRPVTLPKSVREEDCSAMDPGEVWALYNSHERPNWYALIVSRTGGRFSGKSESKKTSSVHIEVKFMEMTDPYADEEANEWNPIRGTGLFTVRSLIDHQHSWISFSHRMDNFLKFDDMYFIFPTVDEVWAVFDKVARSRYLVYVTESRIDRNKAKQGKPGHELFSAKCRLLRRVETELYRVQEKELSYTDLSVFAFRAPYIFKNEGDLLKIELTTRQRLARTEFLRPTQKRRKRGSLSESDLEEDDEGDIEDVDPQDVAIADIMGGVGDNARVDDCGEYTSSPGTFEKDAY